MSCHMLESAWHCFFCIFCCFFPFIRNPEVCYSIVPYCIIAVVLWPYVTCSVWKTRLADVTIYLIFDDHLLSSCSVLLFFHLAFIHRSLWKKHTHLHYLCFRPVNALPMTWRYAKLYVFIQKVLIRLRQFLLINHCINCP